MKKALILIHDLVSVLKDIYKDLKILKQEYGASYLMALISNRGIHSLLFYRLAHFLYKYKIPLLPLILTRIIQIVYSIDIDYRAKIEGGGLSLSMVSEPLLVQVQQSRMEQLFITKLQ